MMSTTDAAHAVLGVGPTALGLPPTVSVDLTALVEAELTQTRAAA